MKKILNTPHEFQFYDKVFIENLTVLASIGIYEWEQTIKQRLEIDVVMYWDNKKAAQSDDVADCLNYAEISEAITQYIQAKPFGLIERVAEEVANLLLVQYMIPAVHITVKKPTAVAAAKTVGVSIFRQS